MSNPELKSLEHYQQFVTNLIKPWPREQRLVLAAAMAERWLPVYQSFSEDQDWGDPSILQRAVEAVWNCALGKKLSSKDSRLLKNRVDENTPHTDDFASDVEEVIATTAMVDYALDSCVSDDNTGDVVMVMVSGFEGVAPGIYSQVGELPTDIWESSEFRDRLRNEVGPLLDNVPDANDEEINMSRQEMMSIPAAWDGNIGPLPPEVWESPEVTEQIEKTVKLRKGLSDIMPLLVEKFTALREQFETPETQKEAEQTAQDAWQLPQVQDELKKQLDMLRLIGAMPQVDQKQIKALRKKLGSPRLVGTVAPRPDPRITNEAVFEQYRRYIENDLKNQYDWESNKELMATLGGSKTQYLSEWSSRYSRRKLMLEWKTTRDVVGRDALLERYLKKDAAVQGDPGWNEATRTTFETSYQWMPSIEGGIEVRSPYAPHRYGPSLRRLCIEGRLAGNSEQDVWNSIAQWGRHRPAVWEEEDRRKKKKLAYATPELAEPLARELSWRNTGDVDYPWATEVAGETWRVGLNDFPDDLMYTLIINDKVTGKFHDWPDTWQRD